jgi:hypothetical protein
MRQTNILFGVLLGLALVAGCFKDNGLDPSPGIPDQTNGRITVINDETRLAARLIDANEIIAVDPAPLGKAGSPQAFSLRLLAEITPPVVNGNAVQATSVVLNGKYAYVSYNMAGSAYIGAIDVIQVKDGTKPMIKSEATFTDTDISSICVDIGHVYTATATGNPAFDSPSIVEALGVNGGGKLDLSGNKRRVLTSYVATSVCVSNGTIYATTGNTGGLYALAPDTLGITSFSSLSDARWVDTDDSRVVVLQGTPGRIAVFDKATGSWLNTFSFSGATIAESKSTVRVIGGKALIAAGDGGVKLMSLTDGSIVGSLPRLIVSGLDPSRSVTNAVDGALQYIFISNGEAGVYVAQASTALEGLTGTSPINLTTLGQLRFQNLQSVNHVAFDGEILIIAAGLGGVKIVSVTY